MKLNEIAIIFAACILIMTSCKKDNDIVKKYNNNNIFNDEDVDDNLRINQLQYIGSHNSYKKQIEPELFEFLLGFNNLFPDDVNDLDYYHLPLKEQFGKYGVRQIELDFYADFDGGRFYGRGGNAFIGKPTESGIPQLLEPGNKVMHIADIDFETHYFTLTETFQAIKNWSNQFPKHLPIFILLETKTSTLTDQVDIFEGFADAEPWDLERLNVIEQEILSVFSTDDIIKPDDVRGNYSTLNEAVLDNNWPTIGESRGKVMFMFDQTNINSTYRQGNASLEGKLIFTSSTPGAPDGAFIKRNNVFSSDIQTLVEQGYIVRTRADSGTNEARNGDYSKLNKALQNGAHFISTDYYRPDPRYTESTGWTDYQVTFENHSYRLNPITN